eukprot:CAMPEP_0185560294 /NCGR_PEP_ID=MMETSP1381-20130426/56604_1 /TAXON_ID=298111 /ORGANISM="Pavlova sp., Strain CCMP459" /LENGTH=36 /DNA_ID= /DNA_START= /DNA_END= /DNA_ORIENTATION=
MAGVAACFGPAIAAEGARMSSCMRTASARSRVSSGD